VDNEKGDSKKLTEASSRRCSQPILSAGSHDPPLAAPHDQLAVELAEEFGLSSKQRQSVTEFFQSHGQGYVRSKAEIVRSQPRKNAAGALLAALRDDWRPPVPVSLAVATEVEHLASSDDLARRMAWQWCMPKALVGEFTARGHRDHGNSSPGIGGTSGIYSLSFSQPSSPAEGPRRVHRALAEEWGA
jgi:hypothetical protein